MNAVDVVALVVGVFFVLGIGVGVIAVIAMAAHREHRTIHREYRDEDDQPRWPYSGYRN
jgi:hypothetical protein